jgi:hypothetical protein
MSQVSAPIAIAKRILVLIFELSRRGWRNVLSRKKNSTSSYIAQMPSRQALSYFGAGLSRWYQEHGRHFPWRGKSCSCYGRVIAEVLLQRTRAEVVAGVEVQQS